MVIVKLIGGLGNQLFQYAAACRLATIHDTDLKMDLSGFEAYKLHKYSLEPFNIKASKLLPKEVEMLCINSSTSKSQNGGDLLIDNFDSIVHRRNNILIIHFIA